MSTSETVLLWIGVAGFVLSVANICWNALHYFRGLQTKIRYVHSTPVGSERNLVLFDVLFWNQSSRVRSVENWDIAGERRLGWLWVMERVNTQIDPQDNGKLVWVDQSGEQVGQPYLRDRVFESPLDIAPHQSQSKWIPLLLMVQPVDKTPLFRDRPWRLWFYARDPNGRRVSKCYLDTTVRELTAS